MDELVSPLIRNGQTMDHIFSEHKEDIPCSERTLYRYIDAGILSVKNIDLPRKVKYKPRKQSNTSEKLSRDCIAGRTYTEFLEYLESHPETNVVEMDTVVGPKPGKVILTMLFRNCTFMLAFLMDNTKSESVIRVCRFLQNELGSETFSRLFPVILTDRGSEFSNPLALARGSLNDRTPFELAFMLLDVKLFELLHLKPVEPDSVLLKPALLWFSFSEQCHIAALTGTAGLQKAEKICTLHPAMTCDNPFSIACSHTGRASTLVPSKKLTPVV